MDTRNLRKQRYKHKHRGPGKYICGCCYREPPQSHGSYRLYIKNAIKKNFITQPGELEPIWPGYPTWGGK